MWHFYFEHFVIVNINVQIFQHGHDQCKDFDTLNIKVTSEIKGHSNRLVDFFLINVFVSLFWGFLSHSRTIQSYGDVTISCEGLQILTYARHSWPLRSQGFYLSHCETGHLFIMSSTMTRDTHAYR